MSSGPSPGEPGGLERELEAEQAAAEHWRRVAEQRATDYADLRRRPLVRAALAVERRAEPARVRAARTKQWLRQTLAHTAVGAGAVAPRLRGVTPPQSMSQPMAPMPDSSPSVVVVVGGQGGGPTLVNPTWPGALEVVHADDPASVAGSIDRALETSGPDLIAVVLPTSEPLDPEWLIRLAGAVEDPVVAATSMVIHPVRPLLQATAHDGLVRAAGLSMGLDRDGVPVVRSIGAGRAPQSITQPTEVAALGAAAMVVDATAYSTAGGLTPSSDLDAAIVELSTRLKSWGGHVVMIPSSLVIDHRPVRTRRELCTPVDSTGPGWAAAIDRSGPTLRRAATTAVSPPAQRFALTVASPSTKVAPRWGDWHLANALASSLRRLGHDVRLQTADHADDPAGRVCDTHIVLRGLQPVRRTPGQRHVLWIISHPESIEDGELEAADLVLVASGLFAAHLRGRTSTPVEVLLQATDHRRFRPVASDPAHRHEVTIVAKTRDVLRPAVADALAAGLRPRIYGGGWAGLVSPELIMADHIDNDQLPTVYSSAGVVLNDHWRTMQAWGFVSNRLFDVLGCGTPVISDPVAGIEELFDGAVAEYHDPYHLRALVEMTLDDPDAARRQAARGRARVLAFHTFDHRANELLAALDRYFS